MTARVREGSASPFGDALCVAAACGIAVALFDVMVGYLTAGPRAFACEAYLEPIPGVVLLAVAGYLGAWTFAAVAVVPRVSTDARRVQIGLALALFAAFFCVAALRAAKAMHSETALAIGAGVALVVWALAVREQDRRDLTPTLHPRNLLLPAVLALAAMGGAALDDALRFTPGGRLLALLGCGAVFLGATRFAPTQREAGHLRWTSPLLALGLAAVGLAATPASREPREPGTGTPPASAPRHVFLITVDTLRATPVTPGGEAPATPHLDAFSASSTSFTRAYSLAPWTMPSVASILTGVSPFVHGVENSRTPLAPEFDTLAERLSRAGYRTGAFGWNPYLTEANGFDQGFDDFFVAPQPTRPAPPLGWMIRKLLWPETLIEELPAKPLTDAALRWTAEHAHAPFFLWLHYFDPHAPYLPHPEHLEGRTPPAGYTTSLGWGPGMGLVQGLNARRQHEREWIERLYNAEIRHLDVHLGRLFDALRERGLYDDALIVFTSDHGQEFWEHGNWGHGQSLYEEQIHVPLVVKTPGQRGGHVRRESVSNEGLVPTVLAEVGLPHDPREFTSPALPLGDEAPSPRRPILATATNSRDLGTAVVLGHEKLIRYPEASHEEFYDLRTDPGELRPRHGADPDAAPLRQALERIEHDAAALRKAYGSSGTQRVLSPAELEQLRSLGYFQ